MKREIDWFLSIKMNVMIFSLLLQSMRIKTIHILVENPWLLENKELESAFFRLCETLEESTIDLDKIVENIEFLEEAFTLFDVEDLKDEIALIQDNTYLELEYISCMAHYINLLANPITSFGEIENSSTEFTELGNTFFSRMEENGQMIKQIRNERRENYIE